MSTDQNADRRLDILLKARWGISLGVGGRAYDRNMRHLAADGLVCIERVGGRGPRQKISRLVLTNEGRDHLLKLGYDPDIEQYVENPGPQYLAECDVIDGTKRRVLMKSGRQNVYLTRPKRTGETQQLIDGPIKYIVYGWNQNETVYHFYDQMADIIKKLLVPAGRLRETGRGLVLDPAFVLRIPSKNHYKESESDWDEDKLC